MKKSILYATVVTTLFIAGCKKDNEKSSTPSIEGKWGLVNVSLEAVEDGVAIDTFNYTGVAADYLDFRSDNKLYSLVDGHEDTSAYQIINNTKLVVEGMDTLDIQSLTSTSVKLYSKVYTDINSYDESTINLKR